MKKFILLLIPFLFFISCNNKMSTSALQKDVQENIQQNYIQNGIPVTITDFSLTHIEGSMYTGVLYTTEPDGYYSYGVDVIYDGESYVWEVY